MGQIRAATLNLPGSYGVNTTEDIGSDQALRYAGVASNGVVDATGKLVSRENFLLQTSGFSGAVEQIYTHRLRAGTEEVYSAAIGKIYSGISTMTARVDFSTGYQVVDVGGAKAGGSSTGLSNDATVRTATITVDGVAKAISIVSSAAQTYTTLLAEINTDLGASATAAIVGGNLRVTSATSGASSTVAIVDGGTPIFSPLTNYVAIRTANAGGTTLNSPQFASLNSRIFMAQAGKPFTCLLETSYAEESIVGQPWTSSPDCVMAAYGRLWAAADAAGSEGYTLWWSNLLDGKTWNSGDAGEIDVTNAWPQGQDTIVGLAAAFSRVIIFGRNSILMYTLGTDNDPGAMTLTDVISNVGCRARDSIVVADDGVYFLSDNGVYRIDRLAQVTSLMTPTQVSQLVNDELISHYAGETMSKVRGGYYPKEGWVVMNGPTNNKSWVFHVRKKLPQINLPIVTTWTNTGMPFRAFSYDKDGNWYCAGTDGIFKYTGYAPTGSSVYTFDFYTQWLNFGAAERLKHLKHAILTLETDSGQTGTFNWQIDYKHGTTNTASFTCSATEFAEAPGIGEVKVHLGRSFNVARLGFSMPMNGDKIALHQLTSYAQAGKTTWR